MTIPDKLPIARMEDYHTHFLGKASDERLFWGYQTFAFSKPFSEIEQGDDWKKYRKEYAILHTFVSIRWITGFWGTIRSLYRQGYACRLTRPRAKSAALFPVLQIGGCGQNSQKCKTLCVAL